MCWQGLEVRIGALLHRRLCMQRRCPCRGPHAGICVRAVSATALLCPRRLRLHASRALHCTALGELAEQRAGAQQAVRCTMLAKAVSAELPPAAEGGRQVSKV